MGLSRERLRGRMTFVYGLILAELMAALGGAQGETLEQQFGEKEVCFRTLDLYTSAVLESTLSPTRAPKPEFRPAMDAMSKARAPPRPPPALLRAYAEP